MPPKGKKGKKGKKGAKKGKAALDIQPTEEDKETLLQSELDRLTNDLANCQSEVKQKREENEWLQNEANRVRLESHEYMTYIEKKTNKRQQYIVSLSDYNRTEIDRIGAQKSKLLEDYNERKQRLQNIIMEKENRLAHVKLELEGLGEFKRLQEEQTDKIDNLEKQIHALRREQTVKLQEMKDTFTKQKQEAQREADALIKETITKSNQEASLHLNQHTAKIKEENAELRATLLNYIHQSKVLQAHKLLLERQHQELLREQQYAKDLRAIRIQRQKRLMKAVEEEKLDFDRGQALIAGAELDCDLLD